MAPERPGGENEPIPVALSANHSIGTNIPIRLLSIPNTLLHIKEGDGASEDRSEKGSEDDDLTSLTWLQDKNLLKGINLCTSGAGVQESPTSDYVDDSASERDSTCSSVNTCPSPTPSEMNSLVPSSILSSSKYKHPNHIPYDPKVHTASKPPYSFSCLIFMAIEDAPAKALPVKEIYCWILEHFPFYKNAPTGWKNSVRHNLSLNKCFRKVDKAPNLGKGSLWMVDPLYRSNLMQTLQKAPYHPCASLRKLPFSTPSPAQKPAAASKVNGSAKLPDPELFPYLSRRLAAVESSDPLDDVHAAAAMLQLKHGPSIDLRKEEYHRRFGEQLLQAARGVKRKIKAELENTMLITSSPSEDHTYSSAEPTLGINGPTSPDEAFADGSDSDSSLAMTGKVEVDTEMEEQRKIAEGADALLNLAGITTGQASSPNAKTPFRPRMLRKPSPAKQRRSDNNADTKTRWKLTVESNNNVERAECEPRPPAKIRRKLAASANKSVNKMKR